MKKLVVFLLVIVMLLTACGQSGSVDNVTDSGETEGSLSWQEQYDLGVRYLSEGNYQEAIIAFTAAIEIDPKQAVVYVGRAQAYVLSGESDENLTAARADYETALDLDDTNADAWFGLGDVYIRRGGEGDYGEAVIAFTAAIELDPARTLAYLGRGQAYALSGETKENLTAAQADFEMAIELDETNADAWLGLADVYIRRGEYEKALEVLREGLEKAKDDQSISDKIAEIESGNYTDSSGHVRRQNHFTAEGSLEGYTEFYFDELGRLSKWINYSLQNDGSSEAQIGNYGEVTYDSQNRQERYQVYDADGTLSSYDTFIYNNDLLAEQHRYGTDGIETEYFLYYYDNQGRRVKLEGYSASGEMYGYWITEYDESGNSIRETMYGPDGEIRGYSQSE